MLDAFDANHTVRHLDDDARFGPRSADVDIIATVAGDNPKPVYVTADLGNRTVTAERQALRDSGMTVIFLRRRFHHIEFHQQAVKLLTLWPQIVRECSRCVEPTAFEITPAANKLNRIGPTREL